MSARRILAAVGTTLAAILLLVAVVAPAADAATGTVATSGINLNVRSGPGTSYKVIGSFAPGAVVSFGCYTYGDSVTGPWGSENIWDQLYSGGYVADAWIYTGSNNPVVPQCSAGSMTGTVSTASGTDLTVRKGPGFSYAPVRYFARGTTVSFSCYLLGDSVTGPWGTETIWDKLDTGGYVADAWIYTGTNNAVVPQCASAPDPATGTTPVVSYNRSASSAFSLNHLNDKELFPNGDCTWFSSQALWAGGLPKSSVWTNSTWNLTLVASKYHYPGPTKDAADANDLVNYLVSSKLATRVSINWSDNTASGAQPGDIIAYHWNYKDPTTGKVESSTEVDHLAFVYGLNKQGYPDVAQHSPAVIRYWSWDPGGNGHPAGWIQQVDKVNGQDPGVWLIHINNGTVG